MSNGWDDLAEGAVEDLFLATKDELVLTAEAFQDGFTEIWPVKSGRSRGSLDAYLGTPPENDGRPANQPFYAVKGHDEIQAVFGPYRLGQEAGFVDQVPYAERLADGWSEKMGPAAIDLLLAEISR